MGWADNLIISTDANVLLESNDVMKYINHRPLQGPFRADFGYNNLHYEIAGRIVENLSGQPYGDFVKSRIFDPLGMQRTFFTTRSDDADDVTLCYKTLDDVSSATITSPKLGNDGYGALSGGLRYTVTDLLKLYGSFLEGFNDQFGSRKTTSKGPPLKKLTHIMSGKIPIDQPSKNEASYAFGWARAQLPGRLGQIGINPGLVHMPLVGKGTSSLVVFHQRSLPGTLTPAALLPEVDVVVVVLANSLLTMWPTGSVNWLSRSS
ncbi:hypothetical protein VUR80DRAFT_1429 [Thermomyces stellatus]